MSTVDIQKRAFQESWFESQEALLINNRQLRWRQLREKLLEKMLMATTVLSSAIILVIIFFVVQKAMPAIQHNGLGLITSRGWDQQLNNAWSSTDPVWKFGALPLVVGTLLTTGGALILTIILGLGCAIFLAELAPAYLRKPIESIVRLLAGIPSVVFGLIGLLVVVPFIHKHFISDALALKYVNQAPLDGQSLIAGVIVLTFMILPFFITVVTDTLRSIPTIYKEASLALGVTDWRTISRLLIPVATPGIIAGAILASARAIGEAIALSMVTGSVSFMPNPTHGLVFFVEPLRTMASAIVDNAEGLGVKSVESALFSLGSILLMFSLSLSLLSRLTFRWFQRRVMGQ